MGAGLLSVIAGVSLAAPNPLGAETPVADAAVIWRAPAGCPDDIAVERRITALVGEPPIPTPATAQVRHAGDHYEVELVTWIDGGSQRRELAASSCTALADAVAVVIAVALDPMETVTHAPVVAIAAHTAAANEVPTGTATAERGSRARGPRKPLQIGFAIGAGYGSGVAPRGSAVTHLGIEVGGVGTTLGWGVVLDTRVWLPRVIDGEGGGSARVLLGTVGALGCAKGLARRVEVPVCLGVEAGGFRARGQEETLDQTSARTYPWVAPRLRVGVRAAIARRVGVWFAAEGAAPLYRARIDVGVPGSPESQELWKTREVSVRVMLGLDFRWVR